MIARGVVKTALEVLCCIPAVEGCCVYDEGKGLRRGLIDVEER